LQVPTFKWTGEPEPLEPEPLEPEPLEPEPLEPEPLEPEPLEPRNHRNLWNPPAKPANPSSAGTSFASLRPRTFVPI